MLWRVRTTLPDRPGALAVLAQNCGAAGVNILGLQIFPDMGSVTDELVLRTPDDWGIGEIARLVEVSGGRAIGATPCTEAALSDQPTRYVQAARAILAQPASFPAVVAQLFDAEADPPDGMDGPVQDVMEMTVGDVAVQVRRTAPFTATEHARAGSMAGLVSDVLERSRRPVPSPADRRIGIGATPEYVAGGDTVSALVDGVPVGIAVVGAAGANRTSVESRCAWTRPGSDGASAPGCSSRWRGWRTASAPRRSCSPPARATRRCCRWCSPRACADGSGWRPTC